tara:strand:- start:88 stop:762 length:675 start_codon:yes stop_codon:yes gene_type:complete
MAMEQKPFKLRSQNEDGSNPSFKAMGAVDAPAKHYSISRGSHDHPHSGLNAMEEDSMAKAMEKDSMAKAMEKAPNKKMHDSPANAMEETPNKKMHDAPTKDMHDAPTKFGHNKKRKTEVKTFPNQKTDPLNIVGGIKQVISDVNTAAGNITSKTQAFGDKVASDIKTLAKTDVPRKFVSDVKNLFSNLSAKNKELNEKKKQRDAKKEPQNRLKKEKKKGNIFGK